MRLLAAIFLSGLLVVASAADAKGKSSGGGRPAYGGGKHTESHGGTYSGGSGSAHKGGTYKNPRSSDRYGTHK